MGVAAASVSWFAWKKIRVARLRKRLRRLKVEEKTLLRLMKKAQEERFKRGEMPESIYKIRMEKYDARLNKIKHTIPVVESALRGNVTKRP